MDNLLDGVEWRRVEYRPNPPDDDGLPYVTHEGVLQLCGRMLRCYQLSTGQRVIDGEDLPPWIGRSRMVEGGRAAEVERLRRELAEAKRDRDALALLANREPLLPHRPSDVPPQRTPAATRDRTGETTSHNAVGEATRRFPICKDHTHSDWNQPSLDDEACVLCRLFYLEAQEMLLEEWQQRAQRAEEAIAEVQRPLDAEMARLNETVVWLNEENERLARRLRRSASATKYTAASATQLWMKQWQ